MDTLDLLAHILGEDPQLLAVLAELVVLPTLLT